jgi:subtilisin family serine protease
MGLFDIVGLTPLMERTRGRPEITVALIDGPVALDHPDLVGQRIHEIAKKSPSACVDRSSAACAHGTFVAGMLAAKRGSVAAAMCPDCSFLLHPIFSEAPLRNGEQPSATPEELAAAIVDSVQAGARVLNLSVNVTRSSRGDTPLAEALTFASNRGVIAVAAAANEGAMTSSELLRHGWVLPVVASDDVGRPLQSSRFSAPAWKRGLSAPGREITSLGTNGKPLTMSGTSAATAFVTGAIALLWSELPKARAADVRFAITNRPSQRRAGVVPPMLNAWSAYRTLVAESARAGSARWQGE